MREWLSRRPIWRARLNDIRECILGISLLVLRRLSFGSRDPLKPGQSVVLYKPDRIGDFILATGVIRFLAQLLGPHRITLLVSRLVAPLAKQQFPELSIWTIPAVHYRLLEIELPAGFVASRRRMRSLSVGTLISLRHQPTLFEDLFQRWLSPTISFGCWQPPLAIPGAPAWWKPFEPNEGFSYPTFKESGEYCRELEAHRRLASVVAGREVEMKDIIPSLKMPVAEDGGMLIVPYGSVGIRTYPSSSLVNAVQSAAIPDARIAVCGEKHMEAELRALAAQLSAALARSVEVEMPAHLLEFVEQVARARAVFCMESAAAHIATALDKRAVIILGGGHHGLFAPWRLSPRQRWLEKRLDCYGCNWRCIKDRPECIQDIPPSDVGAALHEVWFQSGRRAVV